MLSRVSDESRPFEKEFIFQESNYFSDKVVSLEKGDKNIQKSVLSL